MHQDSSSKADFRQQVLLVVVGVVLYMLLGHLSGVAAWLRHVLGILSPVLGGLALAFVIDIFLQRLEALCARNKVLAKHPKPVRALLITLLFLLLLALVISFLVVFIPNLSRTVGRLLEILPRSSQGLTESIAQLLGQFGVADATILSIQIYIQEATNQIVLFLRDSLGTIAGGLLGAVVSTVSTMGTVLFAAMIAIYMLWSKEKIFAFLHRLLSKLLPEKHALRVLHIATLTHRTFAGFVRSQLLISLILGVLGFIGMLLLGLPYPAELSMLVAITSLIPVVGAWIGAIAASLIAAMNQPIQGLMMLIFIGALQQVEGSFIYPHVIRTSVGLPSLLVLVAVILGQSIGGILGSLLAVPFVAVLYTLLGEWMAGKHPAGSSAEAGKTKPAQTP